MAKVNLWLDEKDVNRVLEALTKVVSDEPGKTPKFHAFNNLVLLIQGQAKASSNFVEKSKEYQQVAALVCGDVDILHEVASDKSLDAEALRSHINLTYELKEKAISDPKDRENRFNAGMMLFNLPPGSVRCDTIKDGKVQP